MTISVKDVAAIMQAFGRTNGNAEWEKAAKLQDIWFNYNEHVTTPVPPDIFDFTNIAWPSMTGITIEWLLRSDVDRDGRVKMAFGMLQGIVLDEHGEVRSNLKAMINSLFERTAKNTVELGAIKWSPNVDVKAFHAQRVAFTSVVTDPLSTPIDPLLGTMGSFNFYAIPVGRARKHANGAVTVEITDFVLYALDSFDFVGVQPLGFFKSPDQISKSPFDGGTLISNADYNIWRNEHKKGGDFLVMTDCRTAHLPVRFEFTPPASINGTWRSTDPKGRFEIAVNGNTVEWTEIGLETGIEYKKTLRSTHQGEQWTIFRPNNDVAVLKMLGFTDPTLQQAILNHEPHASFLIIKLQGSGLTAKWHGLRVQKTPQQAFKKLIQPEDPSYPPSEYSFSRI